MQRNCINCRFFQKDRRIDVNSTKAVFPYRCFLVKGKPEKVTEATKPGGTCGPSRALWSEMTLVQRIERINAKEGLFHGTSSIL